MSKRLFCSRKATAILCLLIASLSMVFINAQEKPKLPQISFEVSVKLKLFDVLALDEDGNPVKNLKREDFELFIDGKRWPIQTFDVKKFGAMQDIEKTSDDTETKYAAEMDDFFDKRLGILIFHELRILKKQREIMAKAVFEFLDEKFTKDDLIAIYYMKGSAILMLHPFTDDKQLLKDVIQKALVNGDYRIPFNWPSIPNFNYISRFERDGKIKFTPLEGRINEPWAAGNIEDFKDERPRLHGIKASTDVVSSFHLLINSLALFKGRKEVYLLSDSPPLSFYNYGGTSWAPLAHNMFKKLTTDAMNNNVTINVLDMRKHAYEFNLGERKLVEGDDELIKLPDFVGTKSDPNEFLMGLAKRTDGEYFWYCSKRNEISARLSEISEKSSNVYYLGAYIQDLEPEEKYDIEIKTNREDINLVYHTEFRTRPGYEKMDDVDRKIHFLEAFYGSYDLNNYPFKSEILQFPYINNQTLAITVFEPEAIEKSSSRYDAAVRYFNTDTKNDSQEIQSWDIKDTLAKNEGSSFQVILGAKVVDDEYIYRHVLRDTDSGAISNVKGKVKLGLKDKLLSSIVVLREEQSVLKLFNLLNRKEEMENEEEGETGQKQSGFIFEPAWNPLVFNDKVLVMSINRPVDAGKPFFIMYMYNQDKLAANSYVLNASLLDENGEVVPIRMEKAFPETEFPGGWRRITLQIPPETFPQAGGNCTFKIVITDKNGNTIDTQERKILL